MRRIKVRIHKGRVVEVQHVLAETNRAYAALKKEPKAWEEELKERALWEGTLADGLGSRDQEA